MAKTQVSQPAGDKSKFERASAEKALDSIAKLSNLPSLAMIASCVNSEVSRGVVVRIQAPEADKTFGKFEPIKKSES